MKNIKQVGSLWEHKHDEHDWHTMSIPHPAKTKEITENISRETVISRPGMTVDSKKVESAPPNHLTQVHGIKVSKKDILCKFVVQNGERIGETISLDLDYLVFKSNADKLYIPISSIQEINDEQIVVGEFNREESLKRGEDWNQRTTDRLRFDEKGMLIQ